MAKITLDSIVSGFKSVTKLISNFQKVEDELNNKVLYRDNPDGTANQMESDLDMNSQRLYNLRAPDSNSSAVRWVDVKDGVTTVDAVLPSLSGNENRVLSTTDGVNFTFIDTADLAFTSTEAGAVSRDIDAKLSEAVSVEDFGAAGDGSTDDLAAFTAAIATGKPIRLVPNTTYAVNTVPAFNNSVVFGNGSTLLVATGTQTYTAAITFEAIIGSLEIKGAPTDASVVTGGVNDNTVVGDWDISFTTPGLGTSDVAAGEYAVYCGSSSLAMGNRQWLGAREVVGVTTGFVTLKNTFSGEAPTSSSTSYSYDPTHANALIVVIPTQLHFNNSTDGIIVEQGTLKLNNIIVRGNQGASTKGVTIGPLAELVVDAVDVGNRPSVAIANFATGLSVVGGYANLQATVVSNNSIDGIDVASGGTVQFSTTLTGTDLVSTVSNNNVNIDAANGSVVSFASSAFTSCCAGNLNIRASSNATVSVSSTKLVQNTGATALLANQNGTILANSAEVVKGSYGIRGRRLGLVYADSITIGDTTTAALSAEQGASVYAASVTSVNNTSLYSVQAGGQIVNASEQVLSSNYSYLSLVDGVTVPSTTSGTAFLYVDSSDGDLKVKFGDGTVKTIATDT